MFLILFHTGLSLAYIAEEIHVHVDLTKSKDCVNISCILGNSFFKLTMKASFMLQSTHTILMKTPPSSFHARVDLVPPG